jgi:hypothetical protein
MVLANLILLFGMTKPALRVLGVVRPPRAPSAMGWIEPPLYFNFFNFFFNVFNIFSFLIVLFFLMRYKTSGSFLKENVKFTTPTQQSHNKPSHEGGPHTLGPTLM